MKCINCEYLTRTDSGMAFCNDVRSVHYKEWILQPDKNMKCRQVVIDRRYKCDR